MDGNSELPLIGASQRSAFSHLLPDQQWQAIQLARRTAANAVVDDSSHRRELAAFVDRRLYGRRHHPAAADGVTASNAAPSYDINVRGILDGGAATQRAAKSTRRHFDLDVSRHHADGH